MRDALSVVRGLRVGEELDRHGEPPARYGPEHRAKTVPRSTATLPRAQHAATTDGSVPMLLTGRVLTAAYDT